MVATNTENSKKEEFKRRYSEAVSLIEALKKTNDPRTEVKDRALGEVRRVVNGFTDSVGNLRPQTDDELLNVGSGLAQAYRVEYSDFLNTNLEGIVSEIEPGKLEEMLESSLGQKDNIFRPTRDYADWFKLQVDYLGTKKLSQEKPNEESIELVKMKMTEEVVKRAGEYADSKGMSAGAKKMIQRLAVQTIRVDDENYKKVFGDIIAEKKERLKKYEAEQKKDVRGYMTSFMKEIGNSEEGFEIVANLLYKAS